jgi:formyl-CoA transferase
VDVRPTALEVGRNPGQHQIDEIMPKLEAAGIPYAPIVRPDQLVTDRT